MLYATDRMSMKADRQGRRRKWILPNLKVIILKFAGRDQSGNENSEDSDDFNRTFEASHFSVAAEFNEQRILIPDI
jgi:hypothetical protein